MNFQLHKNISEKLPGFKFAWSEFKETKIAGASEELKTQLNLQCQKIIQTIKLESLSQEPGVALSRKAFKLLGIDPARYRPSQEALMRRIINENNPVRLVNSGVDVNNLLSIRYQMPMGLYDADKIKSEVILKVGESGEHYLALNGRDIDCDGKLIVRDDEGPFGSPFVDSMRTSVNEKTHRLLHVVYFIYDQLSEDDFNTMSQELKKYLNAVGEKYKLN